MATKTEMSAALNDYLGVDIAWERLPKEDLERIIVLFDDPVELIRRIARQEAEDKLKDRSRDIVVRAEGLLAGVPRPFGLLDKLKKL